MPALFETILNHPPPPIFFRFSAKAYFALNSFSTLIRALVFIYMYGSSMRFTE